jgi:hypothetical protein
MESVPLARLQLLKGADVSETQRELTLEEYVDQLPDCHRAKREFAELQRAQNRGAVFEAHLGGVSDKPNARRAIMETLGERCQQQRQWGQQEHEPEMWLAILMEEVGELSQCVLHKNFGGDREAFLREELTQVAAVAQAMLECSYRNNW